MNLIDHYIFSIVVFLPLVAALFITLVPAKDTNSKLAISRFFAALIFLAFLRLFVLFMNLEVSSRTTLSLGIFNFNVTFTIFLTKHNILLYGAAALALLAHTLSHVFEDVKTNIHQVLPFLLTFFLYISFGQNDLRVALPVLSIANFFVYFLIGRTAKSKRGSTIFRMGIFLFSCDALILVLLQIPFSDNLSPALSAICNIALLIPALSRLSVPMFAPFVKSLLRNVDDAEGPLLLIFLQFSGVLILDIVATDLIEISSYLTLLISLVTVLGAYFVILQAITDRRTDSLPYYFFIFYSSIGSSFLFINNSETSWYFCLSLFLTNIACFFHATRCAALVKNYRMQKIHHASSMALWFFTLTLLLGLPGLGNGVTLWPIVYRFIGFGLIDSSDPRAFFWLVIGIAWLLGLALLSFALVLSIRSLAPFRPPTEFLATLGQFPSLRFFMVETLVVVLLSWIIPLATYFTANLGG
ncbi:MAG TPA: hypothetical protein VEL47_07490 [Myxococcota bacterium]|nr:hypothetical protein [Myxococcota bacterium]